MQINHNNKKYYKDGIKRTLTFEVGEFVQNILFLANTCFWKNRVLEFTVI